MTNSEAIQGLERLYGKIEQICYAEKRQLEAYDSIDIAVHCIEENTKLKAEIEQLKNRTEIKNNNFELYSDALDEIERLNSIIDACNKMAKEIVLISEQHLKGKVEE